MSCVSPSFARPKNKVTFSPDFATAPSYRYANLTKDECLAELERRAIPHLRVDIARGVLAPVRIPEGVGGVRYRTELPAGERPTTVWEVFDCRLVLALDDFGRILVAHGVVEAIIFSAWRPPGKTWPEGKTATRHPGGLAVDIRALKRRVTQTPESGSAKENRAPESDAPVSFEWLDVKRDFGGQIGDMTCGPAAAAPSPATKAALELRSLVCTAAAAHIFTSMLTPNHDRAHHNHFHLEVTPGVKWQLVR
ncbi:MAG: hypothetical protein EXR75_01185 [Myxococcales bacterium]|nr:hypothetical protein [Myxococcales bacterium]